MAENGLVQLRKDVFELLQGTEFHAVVLANTSDQSINVESRFFHFGTTSEYLELFTEDSHLKEMLSINALTNCLGLPFAYTSDKNTDVTRLGSSASKPTIGSVKFTEGLVATPCVMHSIVLSGVSLGERSIVEYCTLGDGVKVGRNCIVSHCSVEKNAYIPANTFIHTIPVYANKAGCSFELGYCTVVFGINDNLKASASTSQLQYMGKKMSNVFADSGRLTPDSGSLKLWEAKLFRIFQTVEDSFADAHDFLKKLRCGEAPQNQLGDVHRLSMANILSVKHVSGMLAYRQDLQNYISKVKNSQSCVPRLQAFANNVHSIEVA